MATSVRRPLGRTGIEVFPLGFGSYRVSDGHAGHEAALRAYLDGGGNLIDTSANYADGGSEQLIGRVLKDYPRDQVVIVTKGGYIQGQNMALARARSFPDLVPYAEGLWHCIHPEFLETQLRLSAERLQAEVIDSYLLHNPEYFLTAIAHRHPPTAEEHDEFYRRIAQAFAFLEEQVRAGRIRWYGVSSNHFGLPAGDPVATSVARCLAAARGVSADHHFGVVQLPLNLYESGGACEPNTEGQTVLRYCDANGVGVLANRPLNAFSDNQLIRLADFSEPGVSPPGPDAVGRLLAPLRQLEEEFAARFAGVLPEPPTIAAMLERIIPQVRSPGHFEQIAGAYLVAPIQQRLSQLQRAAGAQPDWPSWQQRLVETVNVLFDAIQTHLAALQQPTSDGVRRRLVRAGYPESLPPEPLTRMAVRVLLSLQGFSSVLVGMRRPDYVAALMELPSFVERGGRLDGEALLRRFAERADPGLPA